MEKTFYIKQSKQLALFGIVLAIIYAFDFFNNTISNTRLIVNIVLLILIFVGTNILKLARIEAHHDGIIFFNPFNIKYKSISFSDIKFAKLHSDRLYILKNDGRNVQITHRQMEMSDIEQLHQIIEQKL